MCFRIMWFAGMHQSAFPAYHRHFCAGCEVRGIKATEAFAAYPDAGVVVRRVHQQQTDVAQRCAGHHLRAAIVQSAAR